MTRRERVPAVVAGKPLDRVPVSGWLHDFAVENSGLLAPAGAIDLETHEALMDAARAAVA